MNNEREKLVCVWIWWRILFSMSQCKFVLTNTENQISLKKILQYIKSLERLYICIPKMIGWENKTVNLWVSRIVVILPIFFGWSWRRIFKYWWAIMGDRPFSFNFFPPTPAQYKSVPCKHWKDWSQEVVPPSVVSGRARGRKSFSFACDIVFFNCLQSESTTTMFGLCVEWKIRQF